MYRSLFILILISLEGLPIRAAKNDKINRCHLTLLSRQSRTEHLVHLKKELNQANHSRFQESMIGEDSFKAMLLEVVKRHRQMLPETMRDEPLEINNVLVLTDQAPSSSWRSLSVNVGKTGDSKENVIIEVKTNGHMVYPSQGYMHLAYRFSESNRTASLSELYLVYRNGAGVLAVEMTLANLLVGIGENSVKLSRSMSEAEAEAWQREDIGPNPIGGFGSGVYFALNHYEFGGKPPFYYFASKNELWNHYWGGHLFINPYPSRSDMPEGMSEQSRNLLGFETEIVSTNKAMIIPMMSKPKIEKSYSHKGHLFHKNIKNKPFFAPDWEPE